MCESIPVSANRSRTYAIRRSSTLATTAAAMSSVAAQARTAASVPSIGVGVKIAWIKASKRSAAPLVCSAFWISASVPCSFQNASMRSSKAPLFLKWW